MISHHNKIAPGLTLSTKLFTLILGRTHEIHLIDDTEMYIFCIWYSTIGRTYGGLNKKLETNLRNNDFRLRRSKPKYVECEFSKEKCF